MRRDRGGMGKRGRTATTDEIEEGALLLHHDDEEAAAEAAARHEPRIGGNEGV